MQSPTAEDLSQRALEALEWSVIRDALAARTRSPLGGALAFRHSPFSSVVESQRLRERVIEGRLLAEQSPVHGYVSGVDDVSGLLERSGREGVLAPAELWACGHFMASVGLLGAELRARAAIAPNWARDFQPAPNVPPVCERITRSVTGDGAVLDSASSELARLRRTRSEKRLEFEGSLNARIKEWDSKGLLQDKFYDQVDGRYVVPVKIEQQSKITGTLVSRSNTGQSVFIEPAELTVSNNALKEYDLSIRAEEYRILRELSVQVGAVAASFAPWLSVVAELDLALAAADLAKAWDLQIPEMSSSDGELRLLEAFHPGLRLRDLDIVKNSFTIPAGGYGMLISGPNTGGKTVLLKAAALASCMARAGLLVPAAKGSKLPHYADVLAFIGDEQNIAAGLSSFSAQIMDMKAVLEEPRKPLLIVIDEILSSTDPEEASALAQALIEEMVARGHHVLVTSHFSELSLRCKANPRIAVAAMEFDGGRPTYRLRPDELGSSHALEVAERLGFPERLLKRARELLSTVKLDYEKAQSELKRKEQELELEHERTRSAMEREKERYKSELREKLAGFMAQAQASVDETVKSLTTRIATYARQGIGMGGTSTGTKATARVEATAKDALRSLDASSTTVQRELGATITDSLAVPVTVGALVRIKSMPSVRGTVLELHGAGAAQTATIQVGNFRFEKPSDDLETLEKPKPKLANNFYVGIDSSGPVARKLDVRGKRYDEALAECEHYIDQAFRSGAAQVTVVTGHGTGALKKGLKELLTGLPYVREFKPEREGDDGATLIDFER